MCLSSVGKEFYAVVAANERCQKVFVRSKGMDGILLSEEERKFLFGV